MQVGKEYFLIFPLGKRFIRGRKEYTFGGLFHLRQYYNEVRIV